MGIQRDRDSRVFAATDADGAVSVGCRGDAISVAEIPAGTDPRATVALHGDRLFGGEIRAENYRVHGESWTPCGGGDRPAGDCSRGGGLLFLEQEHEEETEIGDWKALAGGWRGDFCTVLHKFPQSCGEKALAKISECS